MSDEELLDAYWETQKGNYSPRYLERLSPDQLQKTKESYVGTINFMMFKLTHQMKTTKWNMILPMN